MDKPDYLDALKRAMAGIAPEAQAKTLAYYEQRFVDGVAAGRNEHDIAQELGDPGKIAMTLRASAHRSAFAQQPQQPQQAHPSRPANVLRTLASALGLAVFNLFMLVPAALFSALLAAMFACALAFYVAGIAITASGLAGANELVLDGPLRYFVIDDEDLFASNTRTRVTIGDGGIRVLQEKRPDAPAVRGEAKGQHGIHISTDLDAAARATQIVFGLGMVVGSILLFLLSLVVTKHAAIGVKRYCRMTISLLKGN